MKILFLPFSILSGVIAGVMSKKLFDAIWRLVDDQEAPEAAHKEISLAKLAIALVIEGAIFRVVRGLVDHHARKGFHNMTGRWPGEEAPEQT